MIYLQIVIIGMYAAMLVTGMWIVRLVRELIATIRKVDVTLAVTAVHRPPVSPDPPGVLAKRGGVTP